MVRGTRPLSLSSARLKHTGHTSHSSGDTRERIITAGPQKMLGEIVTHCLHFRLLAALEPFRRCGPKLNIGGLRDLFVQCGRGSSTEGYNKAKIERLEVNSKSQPTPETSRSGEEAERLIVRRRPVANPHLLVHLATLTTVLAQLRNCNSGQRGVGISHTLYNPRVAGVVFV